MLDVKKIVELNNKIASIMKDNVKDCQKIKGIFQDKSINFASDYESVLPEYIRKSIDDRELIQLSRELVAVENQLDKLTLENNGTEVDALFILDDSTGLPKLMDQDELTEVLKDFQELKKQDLINVLNGYNPDDYINYDFQELFNSYGINFSEVVDNYGSYLDSYQGDKDSILKYFEIDENDEIFNDDHHNIYIAYYDYENNQIVKKMQNKQLLESLKQLKA